MQKNVNSLGAKSWPHELSQILLLTWAETESHPSGLPFSLVVASAASFARHHSNNSL